MFSFLKGTIKEIFTSQITLEVNNIGFSIKVPNSKTYNMDDFVTIYTYLNVKEDLLELYGFISPIQKDLFLKLISVKGLGPKGSLNILGQKSNNEIIDAIKNNNYNFFTSVSGIGLKTSQQIVLDLHNKVTSNNSNSNKNITVTKLKDALKNLGYNLNDITQAINQIDSIDSKTLEELLKEALLIINN